MTGHDLIEAALDNTEVFIDSVIDSEILKSIPVIGTAVKVLKGCRDIRDSLFAAKISRFLQSLGSISSEKKEKIRSKMAKNPTQAKQVGETVLLFLDKCSSLDKADIIARLFLAYIYGYLEVDEFRRITDAVDQAFIEDVYKLVEADKLPNQSKEPFMQYLSRTGFTQPVAGKTFADIGEIYYEVTSLGNKLISSFHIGMKYSQQ